MLGTKGVNTQNTPKVPAFISYGIEFLKFNSIEAVERGGTTYLVTFKVETPPVEDDNFSHPDGNKGRTGNVGMWLDLSNPKNLEKVNVVIGTIGDEFGLRKQIDAITDADPKVYFAKLAAVLCNGTYGWFVLAAREYALGKFGLSFPTFRFCHSADKMDPESIVKDGYTTVKVSGKDPKDDLVFDKTKTYHYNPYKQPTPTDDTQLNTKFGLGTAKSEESPVENNSEEDDLPFSDLSEAEEPSFLKSDN